LPRILGFKRQIILLTDGLQNFQSCEHNNSSFDYMKQYKQEHKDDDTRIFTVSIESAADRVLMQNLAEISHGSHHHVNIDREIPEVLTKLIKNTTQPTLLDCQVNWGNNKI